MMSAVFRLTKCSHVYTNKNTVNVQFVLYLRYSITFNFHHKPKTNALMYTLTRII